MRSLVLCCGPPNGDALPQQSEPWLLYSWLPVSPDQEAQVCDALVNLGWLENDHALHAEGVRAIRQALGCSMDDAISGTP